MENQPIARLTFTCNRNWEDMQPVENGRFCNDCQKKVIDFTDKTNEEIAAYLISSSTKVCGRFQNSQLAPAAPKPISKRWLSAAAMFAAVFMGIKEASAQTVQLPINKTDTLDRNKRFTMGEVVVASYVPKSLPAQKVYAFNEVEVLPSFPGGDKAFAAYIRKNAPSSANADATGIASFVVDKYGNVLNITIMKSANATADEEAIKAFRNSPRWKPGIKNGEAVAVRLVLPFSFTKKNMEKFKF